MSRRRVDDHVLKLPHKLQVELGIDGRSRGYPRKRKHGVGGSRKEQRKAARLEKKLSRTDKRQKPIGHAEYPGSRDDSWNGVEDDNGPSGLTNTPPSQQAVTLPESSYSESISKDTHRAQFPLESSVSISSRELSPGLVLDRSSISYKDAVAQDDRKISTLEKKLGLKGKKLSKSFADDGLGEILGGFDSDEERKKRKRDALQWLEKKRRKTDIVDGPNGPGENELRSDSEDGQSELSHSDQGESSPSHADASDIDDTELSDQDVIGSTFDGFDPDSSQAQQNPKRVRENPYVAPTIANAIPGRYIPPSLRERIDNSSASTERLRRQMQGHFNKLSEANIISILREIEHIYEKYPRPDVISVFVDVILTIFCNRSALPLPFVILHAAFSAAAYKVFGANIGAEMISGLIERLEKFLGMENLDKGKEANNLISLLCHLFIFDVIGSAIIFDYTRLLLKDFSEFHTELLLRIVRDCGPQLRHDNPIALRDSVQIMQDTVSKMNAEGRQMTVRAKFMIETINDLKNNKMKAGFGSTNVATEHLTRMRKVLGQLNNRKLRGPEPLGLSQYDIKNSDKQGKWWLVGASWKGKANLSESQEKADPLEIEDVEVEDAGEPDMLALAKDYKMNTDIRRSIFVAIMSANDFKDAHTRLLKLRLRRVQEQEIPKVLLRCSGAEAVYNPYYTLIAKSLCSEKKMKTSFQFCLWDFFKRLGEKGDIDDSDQEAEEPTVELPELVNVAKMYAVLIAEGFLPLGVLKVLNLAYLKPQAKTFVEILLVSLMTKFDISSKGGKSIERIFGRAAEAPQMIQGLQHLLKRHVRQSDLVAKKDGKRLTHNCKVAEKILSRILIGEMT